MSKTSSGYERQEHEHYPTPAWVIDALSEHLNLQRYIWEPACGTGQMAEAIRAHGAKVMATDIHDHGYNRMNGLRDFLESEAAVYAGSGAIITDPPYGLHGHLAVAFINKGLKHLGNFKDLALLLPEDFDAASTRYPLFGGNPQYAGTIKLLKRIKWFDHAVPCKPCGGTGQIAEVKCIRCKGKGEKKSGPSENHAWFLWSTDTAYPARVRYAPMPKAMKETLELPSGRAA